MIIYQFYSTEKETNPKIKLQVYQIQGVTRRIGWKANNVGSYIPESETKNEATKLN